MPEELTEKRIREIIREERASFDRIDRYTIQKLMQFFDGRNIQTGRTTGTKIGLSALEKSSFHGSTPVIQASAISAPTITTISGSGDDANINANFSALEASINSLRTALSDKGIIAT